MTCSLRIADPLILAVLAALVALAAAVHPALGQCTGSLTIQPASLEFPATYAGSTGTATLILQNTGNMPLCLLGATVTAPVWSVPALPPLLEPGELVSATVEFHPALDRWYFGTLEFRSSDPLRPRDSVRVAARGCGPALPPSPPVIVPSGSPEMVYFSLPWDGNSVDVEYAVRLLSLDNGDVRYVGLDGGLLDDPLWATAMIWGSEGAGAAAGLEPETHYSVALLARDATGFVAAGLPVDVTTPSEIIVSPLSQLVCSPAGPNAFTLNWNGAVHDLNGMPLPFDGYAVLFGTRPDSIRTLVAFSDLPQTTVSGITSAKGFFTVIPMVNGSYTGISPCFSYPPEGALLYGLNTVALRDPANIGEWSSYTVQMDSLGIPVLLASSDSSGLPGTDGLNLDLDFDAYGVGPHVLTATVFDRNGLATTVTRFLQVVARPHADFTASYDQAGRTFSLFAYNVTVPQGDVLDVWWPALNVDERYGTFVQFESKAGAESLHIVKPYPVGSAKLLNQEAPWPRPGEDLAYGVMVNANAPGGFQLINNDNPASPCCIGIEIDTVNIAATKGVDTLCTPNASVNDVTAGFRFMFRINWEWRPGTYQTGYSSETRYTYVETTGKCNGQVFTANPSGPGNPVTTSYRTGGQSYPYSGPAMGDLNRDNHLKVPPKHDPDPPAHPRPYASTAKFPSAHNGAEGKPVTTRRVRSGSAGGVPMAIELKGDVALRVTAFDECPGESCEENYVINWDVIFCEDCHKIIVTMPHITATP